MSRSRLLLALLLAPALARAGAVRGLARFDDRPPPRNTVPTTKDRAACGESAEDESVRVTDGGLANVVVRVVVPGAKATPRAISLDQQRCRFAPHVQAAPVGSTIELSNGDPILHSVHAYAGIATAFDVPIPPDAAGQRRTLARPGVIRVGCDIHGWMSAWIVVVDTPHYAVTDARGRFTMSDLPPGSYTAIAWHEALGEKVVSVTVPERGEGELVVAYP